MVAPITRAFWRRSTPGKHMKMLVFSKVGRVTVELKFFKYWIALKPQKFGALSKLATASKKNGLMLSHVPFYKLPLKNGIKNLEGFL